MASITKRGKSYRFKVSAGYDAGGSQIVKTMTWTPPANMTTKRAEKEAQHQAALFEERIRKGQYVDEQRVKFQTFVETRWFPNYADVRLRPRTVAGYHDLMQRVYPEIGHLYLDQIRPAHLVTLYRKLSTTQKQITYHAKDDMKQLLKKKGYSVTSFASHAGISRTAQYLPGQGVFTDETKNRSSNRVISISNTVVNSLRELKVWQAEQRLKLGKLWKNKGGNVFVLDDGTPIQSNTLSRWFHNFIAKTDLPQIHLHSLRHTCATLSITNGVSVNVVAGQLGHATPETTTRIYTHSIQAAQAAAADLIDDLLTPPKKETKAVK